MKGQARHHVKDAKCGQTNKKRKRKKERKINHKQVHSFLSIIISAPCDETTTSYCLAEFHIFFIYFFFYKIFTIKAD